MDDVRKELRDAERAAAAPYTEEPRSPAWYPLLMAAFATAMVGGPVLVARGYGFLGFSLQAAAVVAVAVFYARHQARAGAVPRMRGAPPEIRGAYRWLLVLTLAVVAATVAAWLLAGWPAGLGVVFVGVLAVVQSYERRIYPRAVDLLRDRLA